MGLPCPPQTRRRRSSGKLPDSDMGSFHEVALYQLDGVLHGALAADYGLECRLPHSPPQTRIREELCNSRLEQARVRHQYGATRLEEQLRALPEIGRVGTEQDGLSQECRLQYIVPARGHQAAPDEDDRGHAIDLREISHGVEYNHRLPVAGLGQIAAADGGE